MHEFLLHGCYVATGLAQSFLADVFVVHGPTYRKQLTQTRAMRAPKSPTAHSKSRRAARLAYKIKPRRVSCIHRENATEFSHRKMQCPKRSTAPGNLARRGVDEEVDI